MKKQIYPLLFLALTISSLNAQFYDNHWMMGYLGGAESEPNDSFGISTLSFYDAELQIDNNQEIDIFFQDNGTALSNFAGDLSLYSNGIEIRNDGD